MTSAMKPRSNVKNHIREPLCDRVFSAIVYVVPAVCFLLAILPLAFYRLKPAQIDTIRAELENRRTAEK